MTNRIAHDYFMAGFWYKGRENDLDLSDDTMQQIEIWAQRIIDEWIAKGIPAAWITQHMELDIRVRTSDNQQAFDVVFVARSTRFRINK